MEYIDVRINEESLMDDYHCLINSVTLTPLVKKQYLVDVPGADGSRDLTAWFGAPRFEMRTMKIYCQCCAEGAVTCAERMSNLWAGREVEVRLSIDEGLYYTGTVMGVVPVGAGQSDEICISISCDPCRWRDMETVYDIPASEVAVAYTWVNGGTLDVVPELTALDADVIILRDATSISMSVGTALVPELAIAGSSEIAVEVYGGALQVRYREAMR